ncbi:MAG: beta-lactamase family protein [Desulfatitalea sp.]|nr:beta-lactamase family protein [Desulfatitalea sp.]NNK02804.1 beta-lactamase family protein [Desulfatitalea sp.]
MNRKLSFADRHERVGHLVGAMGPAFRRSNILMQTAIDRGIFPGAVLMVASVEEVLLHRAYGMADLFCRQPMMLDTVFDLASLTKPLATTLAVMKWVEQGRLDLDYPCQTFLPWFGGRGKNTITIRHLLSHTSGLPAWRPYYLRLHHVSPLRRRTVLQQWVGAEALGNRPGQRCEYSDIGFMVLQWILEQMSGQPLHRLAEALLWRPLGIDSLFFIDLSGQSPQHFYAATEFCPWRAALLKGRVHDDNAFTLGGVAGHAGLFGCADGVMRLLRGLLSADLGKSEHALFKRDTIHAIFQRQSNGRFALGFDTPDEKDSSAGCRFSSHAVGHLGYTGTSFWLDRRKGVIVLLLTNRVHPTRYNNTIRAFRPKLHDAVMADVLGD